MFPRFKLIYFCPKANKKAAFLAWSGIPFTTGPKKVRNEIIWKWLCLNQLVSWSPIKECFGSKDPCLEGREKQVLYKCLKSNILMNQGNFLQLILSVQIFGTPCKPHILQMEPWEPPPHPQLSVAGTGTLVERPPSRLQALYTQIQIHINTNSYTKIQNTT